MVVSPQSFWDLGKARVVCEDWESGIVESFAAQKYAIQLGIGNGERGFDVGATLK